MTVGDVATIVREERERVDEQRVAAIVRVRRRSQ